MPSTVAVKLWKIGLDPEMFRLRTGVLATFKVSKPVPPVWPAVVDVNVRP